MTKGLVLAGGGAKGSYQVGVYKALDELDWRPGVIAGTSVGCLNGALFALDDWELAQEMWLTIGDGQVMEPAPDGRPADWGDFLQAAVEHGGMDVTLPNLTGLPTTCVRSYWDLGPILRFEPATAKRNIALGYQDCYRAFGRLAGTAYALRAGEDKKLAERFVRPYARLLRSAISRSPSLALTEGAALRPMERWCTTEQARALAPLERAAELAGVDPVGIYTADELCDAFLQKSDGEAAARFYPLLRQEAGWRPMEAAVSAAVPGEFLTALVRFVLTEQ